jgi:non-ribosomal peptide synthetase component E (peptide arylation enzyme)
VSAAAVVVADSDFDLDSCRLLFSDRGVTRFKTPEAVLHVDGIPVTATGKVDRCVEDLPAILTNEVAE